MTLNFWPFDGDKKRVERERNQAHELRLAELRAAFREDVRDPSNPAAFREDTSTPTPCEDCGGMFIGNKLKPVTVITFFRPPDNPPTQTQKFYCKKCLPTADIEVELESTTGAKGNLDTVYLSTREHYLQPFDFQGVEQTFIPAEDYPKLYCNDCGILTGSPTTICRTCTKPKSKKRSRR